MNYWHAILCALATIGAANLVAATVLAISAIIFHLRHNLRHDDILPICEDFDPRETPSPSGMGVPPMSSSPHPSHPSESDAEYRARLSLHGITWK